MESLHYLEITSGQIRFAEDHPDTYQQVKELPEECKTQYHGIERNTFISQDSFCSESSTCSISETDFSQSGDIPTHMTVDEHFLKRNGRRDSIIIERLRKFTFPVTQLANGNINFDGQSSSTAVRRKDASKFLMPEVEIESSATTFQEFQVDMGRCEQYDTLQNDSFSGTQRVSNQPGFNNIGFNFEHSECESMKRTQPNRDIANFSSDQSTNLVTNIHEDVLRRHIIDSTIGEIHKPRYPSFSQDHKPCSYTAETKNHGQYLPQISKLEPFAKHDKNVEPSFTLLKKNAQKLDSAESDRFDGNPAQAKGFKKFKNKAFNTLGHFSFWGKRISDKETTVYSASYNK
ncbi:hypothetical protein EDC01DRAFT_635279 [Geopyxis carbonaria]|nr:hypothetical protein EDC01DRAFT_635279 [Geopyxis carbonaria]